MAGSSRPHPAVLEDDLLKLLECPVCASQMTAPIEQCSRGHSVCKGCRENIELCPICRAEFQGCRNYMAEDLSDKILFPCENIGAGCLRRLSKREMASHRRSCAYRLYKCLAGTDEECQWAGPRPELFNHVKAKHRNFLWTRIPLQLSWTDTKFENTCHRCCLLAAYGEIFWYFSFVDSVKKSWRVCVQFIGPEERASEFQYRFEFKSSDRYRELNFTDITKNDLRDLKSIIESRECLELSLGVVKFFTDQNSIVHYNFNVLRKESL